MKKSLILAVILTVAATPAFARYIVALKNGTSYLAKEKWTVVNGKAIVKLENGQSLQLDPALIDLAKSEQLTKIGTAGASVVDLNPDMTKTSTAPRQSSLGTAIKLRPKSDPNQPSTKPTTTPVAATVSVPAGSMAADVIEKFKRAYENDGIFETNVSSTGSNSYRVELTVDTEERVFGALSTTSAMIMRNAFVEGAKVELVELFMKTTTGGAAGRFQMSHDDADALLNKKIKREDYFITKVIY
jgi:hypothetical protein